MVGRVIWYNPFGQETDDPQYNRNVVMAWDFTLEQEKLKALSEKIHFATEEEDHWNHDVIPWLEKYTWLVEELTEFADYFLAKPCVEGITFGITSDPDGCTLPTELEIRVKKEWWLKYCRVEKEKLCDGKTYRTLNYDDREKFMGKVMSYEEADRFIKNDLGTPGLWYIWPHVSDDSYLLVDDEE